MACENEDRFFYIVEQVKDMIVTGDFNVFHWEKDFFAEHSAAELGVATVDEALALRADGKWGTVVTAVVMLRPASSRDDAAITAMTT